MFKEKQNHYNIKFLKGYGFSINVKNSKIILKNTTDPFSEPEVEEWFVNSMPYEKIVMSGKGYISTEALDLLSQHHRNLILLDVYGRPITYLNPVVESLTNTQYRIGQYDTFRDESKRDYLSRQIVKAKLYPIKFAQMRKNWVSSKYSEVFGNVHFVTLENLPTYLEIMYEHFLLQIGKNRKHRITIGDFLHTRKNHN